MSSPMRDPADILRQLQGKSGKGAIRHLTRLGLTTKERRALVDYMMYGTKPDATGAQHHATRYGKGGK